MLMSCQGSCSVHVCQLIIDQCFGNSRLHFYRACMPAPYSNFRLNKKFGKYVMQASLDSFSLSLLPFFCWLWFWLVTARLPSVRLIIFALSVWKKNKKKTGLVSPCTLRISLFSLSVVAFYLYKACFSLLACLNRIAELPKCPKIQNKTTLFSFFSVNRKLLVSTECILFHYFTPTSVAFVVLKFLNCYLNKGNAFKQGKYVAVCYVFVSYIRFRMQWCCFVDSEKFRQTFLLICF